jgi:lipoate-protein ligase B
MKLASTETMTILNKNPHPISAMRNPRPGTWLCLDLATIDYQEAWKLQSNLVDARRNKAIDSDIVLFLEHPPVFTLGRRGGLENLMVSRELLDKSGITIIQVERGGNITYHGPGQLVVYPIIKLERARLRVLEYVEGLEEIMIRTALDWGVGAQRNPVNRGVWVGNNKLGSIGIAVRRGISFHGLALNVNLSLEPFGWINPCGLQNYGMTSLQQEISSEVSMECVRKVVKLNFESVFGIQFAPTNLNELQPKIKSET